MSDLQQETLIFDGDCGFCSTVANWLNARFRYPVAVVPYQWVDLTVFNLTLEEAAAAVRYLTADGTMLSGAAAIAAALKACRNPLLRLAGLILGLKILTPITNPGYRLLARYRHRLPGGTPTCKLPRS